MSLHITTICVLFKIVRQHGGEVLGSASAHRMLTSLLIVVPGDLLHCPLKPLIRITRWDKAQEFALLGVGRFSYNIVKKRHRGGWIVWMCRQGYARMRPVGQMGKLQRHKL
uniref:Secreted protein n=1 Tax=Parascaris univalens TaxID=6257 RepID=A0A915CDB9_PARUN